MSVVDAMMHGAMQGAKVGALLGSLMGLAPLGLGLYRRQRSRALTAFGICFLAGVVGGLYGAIAAASITLAPFLKPKQPGENNPP